MIRPRNQKELTEQRDMTVHALNGGAAAAKQFHTKYGFYPKAIARKMRRN